jgi:uncharacterized membrane protein
MRSAFGIEHGVISKVQDWNTLSGQQKASRMKTGYTAGHAATGGVLGGIAGGVVGAALRKPKLGAAVGAGVGAAGYGAVGHRQGNRMVAQHGYLKPRRA